MVNVLFVCLGNICRSPMAEAVFRKMLKKEGLESEIEVDSAGTGDWHIGKNPHHGTQEILDKHQVDYQGIVARQFDSQDFQRFQYIITMDAKNLEDIKSVKGYSEDSFTARLMDLVSDGAEKNVPDPYFTGDFEETYALVERGCKELLELIRKREGL